MSQNTRSLLMDSLSLPRFDTIDELADITGLSSRLLFCLSMKTSKYYKFKNIPKRNGSQRKICIPSYTLSIIQRWILENIINKIVPSARAMAFRKGGQFGYKVNAFYHSKTLYGLSLDIKDFFPSINSNKIYTLFSNIGYNKLAATILTNLCTLDGKLPQGSPCSPALSNLVCISLDKRLIGFCEKRGIRFTRYADDMYFSCDDKVLLIKHFPIFEKIINSEGFILNDKKTYFHTPTNRKMITGITVHSQSKEKITELKANKTIKNKIRAEIFRSIISGNYTNINHILGEISYVRFIEKENKLEYLPRLKKYIADVGEKICYFPELVEAYNQNLFFEDIEKLQNKNAKDIYDISEQLERENVRDARTAYLEKHKINDICMYINWLDGYL